MAFDKGPCPLTERQQIEQYFIENRTRVLEVAAFLDRIDRAIERDPDPDFRIRSFREALTVLTSPAPDRVNRIQMIFSDQDLSLLDKLDRKSAFGASVRRAPEEER